MVKLIITSGEKVRNVFLDAVKHSSPNVICVLSSKSFEVYRDPLSKVCNNKSKSCLFIDTVVEESEENVVYIPSSNLTALSIAINQAQQSFNGKTTVVFDSISALAVNNDENTLTKFLLFLSRKSRDWGCDLVFIVASEGLSPKVLDLLKQSSDEVKKK